MKGYKVHKENIFSITEARRRIFDLAQGVQEPGTYYVLTEHGRPKVVLVSSDWFESLIETLEIIEDFPMLDDEIRKARMALTTGKTFTLSERALQPCLVADKGGAYEVSRCVHKRRARPTRQHKQKRPR